MMIGDGGYKEEEVEDSEELDAERSSLSFITIPKIILVNKFFS